MMLRPETDMFFNAEIGRIEGKYSQSSDPHAPLALILHSNPAYGGNMSHPVVEAICSSFMYKNFTTLRINFRGVGRSEGVFGSNVGEVTDAGLALDWLEANNPGSNEFWVAGFSFGSWVALQLLMRRPEVSSFLAVSPPIDKYDFSFLSPCPTPGLIAHGDMDSVVSEKQILEFIRKISKYQTCKVEYKSLPDADHFFRDKLTDLRELLCNYLDESPLNTELHELAASKNKSILLD